MLLHITVAMDEFYKIIHRLPWEVLETYFWEEEVLEIDWEKCRTFFTLQKTDLNALSLSLSLSLFYGDVNALDFQIIIIRPWDPLG